jgi:hypothetical protein
MEKPFWDMDENEAREYLARFGSGRWKRKVAAERALAETETSALANPWIEESFSDERQRMILGYAPEWAELLQRAAEEDETAGE